MSTFDDFMIGEAVSQSQQILKLSDQKRALVAALNKADQQLSGIQQYSSCKTAQSEAALIRADIRVALQVSK